MKRSIVASEKAKKIRIDYTDNIPDDLLHEILIRLPNLKSSIVCSSVCKRWSSITSRSDFRATFIQQYRSREPPLTLIFGDLFISTNPIRVTLPQRLPFLVAASMVDFFPWLNNMYAPDATLVAMCDNLFLLNVFGDYCVCNPCTGQRSILPPPPKVELEVEAQSPRLARCGLVSEPSSDNKKQLGSTRYRVMLLFEPDKNNNDNDNDTITVYITVFCSETGQWTQVRNHNLPMTLSSVNCCDVVAINGTLYWLGSTGIVALRPVYVNKGYIVMTYQFGSMGDDHVKLRLGFFEGCPRFSQLFREDDSQALCLRIWDMKLRGETVANMKLVSQVRIEALDGMSVSVLALHPNHPSQIFLLRNHNVYQYDTETNKQLRVAEIHCNDHANMPDLRLFLVQPPVWPSLF